MLNSEDLIKKVKNVSFCLIVPMFNEENNVIQCVESICKFLYKLENRCELLVVNDGSFDKTSEKLSKLQTFYENLNIETHPENKGYGVANRTGLDYAYFKGYDYVLYMDADLTQDPKYINDFLYFMNKDIDFIKATRYSLGGGTKGVTLFRKFISLGGNLMLLLEPDSPKGYVEMISDWGIISGEGTLIDDEGTVFEGKFVEGKPTEGIMEFDDGSMYGGGLNEKGLHGTGIIIGEDGTQMSGTFENNEMHGFFEVTDEEGYFGMGEYKHNQRHGYWREKDPDGSKWDVKYEDGEVVWSDERKIELVPDK